MNGKIRPRKLSRSPFDWAQGERLNLHGSGVPELEKVVKLGGGCHLNIAEYKPRFALPKDNRPNRYLKPLDQF
jgi:hypothetical protein